MITRLSQVTDEHRATLKPDEWRLLVLAELGDLSRLAAMPWARLRTLELVPGFRLDASPIVMPEDGWLPTSGSAWRGARTIDASAAAELSGGSIEAILRRDECIRRAMLALWLPALSGRDRNPLNPTTWVETIKRMLKLVGMATVQRPDVDGRVFSHLVSSDIEAILLRIPEANKRRQLYGHLLRRLAEAGRHGILNDYPSLQAPAESDGGVSRRRLAGAIVRAPIKKAEAGSWQPFPDAFVSELMRRALWVQEHLADQILDCWALDLAYMRTPGGNRGPNHPTVQAERKRMITGFDWRFQGGPMTELPFEVLYQRRELSNRLPRVGRELGVWVGLVQALNIHVIAFCTAARKAEIGSATEASVALPQDGNWRFAGRTWKLARKGGGAARDWPLHPVGVRALEIQRKLAGLVPRPVGKDYLWVLARQPGTANFGRRMLGLEDPVTDAVERLNLGETAKSSRSARRLAQDVLLGADSTMRLTGEQAHLHRWRHTVGRLVARTVVEAPQILFDLFGHRDHAMTLRYMVADPDIGEDAERIAREIKVVRARNALRECMAGEASGPAAAPLRAGLAKVVPTPPAHYGSSLDEVAEAALVAMGLDVEPWSQIDDVAERVTSNGARWNMVRPGVLCSKGLDEFGPCTQGRGVPDPGSCRTTCSHRLERASAKEECRAELKALLREYSEAKENDRIMLAVNLEGQIRANLHRWPDVREDILRSHPDAEAVWARVAA